MMWGLRDKTPFLLIHQSPFVTSGIRLGTAALTSRGMKEDAMKMVGEIMAMVLLNSNKRKFMNKLRRKCSLCKSTCPRLIIGEIIMHVKIVDHPLIQHTLSLIKCSFS